MKMRTAILLLMFVGLAAASPASGKHSAQAASSGNDPMDTEGLGYEGAQMTVFLYSEGIKQAEIYSDTAKAMSLFDAAIATDSLYAPAYYHCAATIGPADPKRALEYSLAANRLDSANQWYRSQLGRLLLMNERVDEAYTLYEADMKRNPRNPESYNMLAMIYRFRRQPYRAIALLDSAETYLGRTAELISYKREILMSVGLYDRAIAETRTLIQDNPYDYSNYLTLAQVYVATNKDSLADANFEIARALNPDGVDVIGALNDYYVSRGDMPKFFETARRLILSDRVPREFKLQFFEEMTDNIGFYRENFPRIDALAGLLLMKYPGDFEVMRLYTQTKIDSGNLETALSMYKSTLDDPSPDIRMFSMILDMEAYRNRSDSVAKYARMAQERFPDNPEFYLRHGSALGHYMEKRGEAVALYEKALGLVATDSARSVIYGMIGDMHQAGGDTKKSSRSYEKAIKLWPENILVLNNYAYHLSEQGVQLKKALEMSARVMELEPGNATYIDTYGWVLYKLGRFQEAKEYLLRAISLDPRGSGEIFLHYGDVLYALGDDYLATMYWRKAAEAGYDKQKIEERLKKADKK